MSLHSQQPLNQSVHFAVVPCGSTLLMHRTVRTLPALSVMSFSLSWHQRNGNETKVFGLYLIESKGWEIIRQSHVVKLLRAESVWLHPEIKLSGCASHCWSHCDFHGSRVVLCDKKWWIHTPGNTPYLYLCVCVCACVRAWPHLSTTSHDPECCLQMFSFMSSVCVSVTVAYLWLVFVCVCLHVCLCVSVPSRVCEGPGESTPGHFKACVQVMSMTQMSREPQTAKQVTLWEAKQKLLAWSAAIFDVWL